jgi:putative oxidoreductase
VEAMKTLLRHPWTVRVCRIAIGVVFAYAGLAKVGDLAGFAQQIHNFRMVPIFAENVLAMTLPWIEIVAALALILCIRARSAAVLTTALLVVFTIAVAAAYFRGLDIECGCFGTSDAAQVGLKKLLENVGMIAVGAIASLREAKGSP